MKYKLVWILLCLSIASVGLAGPLDVPILFTNAPVSSLGTSVFVVGSVPQLGNWDPLRAVKMIASNCVGQTCTWWVKLGIPEATSYEYKFIQRKDCATCLSNGANVTWESGANRTGNIPAGPPAPYSGKTVFYYKNWSNVSLLYSNLQTGWATLPMTQVGVGRTNIVANEKLWRVDNVNGAGQTNLIFVFTDGVNYDNPDGVAGRNYETPLDAFVVQDGSVYNYWPPAAVSTNRVVTFTKTSTNVASRTVRVYLPRGFTQNTTKRYPVLYMHDGQNLFLNAGPSGGWHSDTNAQNLIRYGKMRETIIVGVDNSSDRLCEYAPPGCTFSQCSTPRGDKYAEFLVNELKPHIDNTYTITAGRTLTDADNTGALGSSLGGLISSYLGWQRSSTFHKLGCMSSSFWICAPIPAPDSKRPIRIYLDSGNKDVQTSTIEADTDSILDTLAERDNLLQNGYVLNDDLDHTIGYGHWHNEIWWDVRSPRAFAFLFPTSDEPNTVLESVAPVNIVGFQSDGESNIVSWTSYLKRTYTIQGSTNEDFSPSMNWSNVVTTAPEYRFWNYPSVGVTNEFHFLRVRQNTVPNWPN